MDDITVTVTLTFAEVTLLVATNGHLERVDATLFAKLMDAYIDAADRVEAAADKMQEEDGNG